MKNLKPWYIASGTFAALGVICFIVKFVELTLRTEHKWAETFVVLGIVFLAIAILVLGVVVLKEVLKNKNTTQSSVSEEELLSKYKSKSKK